MWPLIHSFVYLLSVNSPSNVVSLVVVVAKEIPMWFVKRKK